ncbi:imelysin family protein [Aquihabitans daechungensis]|uniref:imelysin family protein n=1 Tax=Aquihabitans daechungensis TaxID=1052257 RepID=UPI003BA0C215
MRTSKASIVLLATGLLLSACTSDDGGSPEGASTEATVAVDTGEMLQGLADDVIVPSYVSLSEALGALGTSTDALCDAPSAESLATAREAWQETDLAYQRTRAAGVGPALEDRLMSDVAFAARPTVIDDLLESDDPVDEAALADEGSAARGIYASEIALFGEGSESMTSAAGARRCEYAASVAALAQDATAAVTEQWTDGDAVEDFVAGLDGGPQSSVALVVNEVSHRLEEIDAMGLRDMAEADGAEGLDPGRLGGPAGQRLASRKALLEGVLSAIGDGTTGISALTGVHDGDTRDRLVATAREADGAMAALPDSVPDAFDDPAEIEAASQAVAELKVLVSTEVASQLGVTITFSDSDGDS